MNPTLEQRAEAEINSLIVLADDFVSAAKVSPNGLSPEEIGKVTTWLSRIGQLIRKLYGKDSQHFESYKELIDHREYTNLHCSYYIQLCEMRGILEAIQHELRAGLLSDFRKLLQASIFADFLEMAEYLLTQGYRDSAAVMIGTVLEDSLRKLADANGISKTQSSSRQLTINLLNVELAKAGVYGPLVQKQVTTWADLRNSAAHGHYNKYDSEQVKQMLLFVQKFCSDYLQ